MKKEDLKVGMTIRHGIEEDPDCDRKILFISNNVYVYESVETGEDYASLISHLDNWDPVPETQTIKLFRYTYKKFIKFTPDFLYDQSFWTTRSYEIFSDMQGTQNAVLVKTEEKEIEVPE